MPINFSAFQIIFYFHLFQDTLFFLKTFFIELSGNDEEVASPRSDKATGTQHVSGASHPPPVMSVNKEPAIDASAEPQNLLMQFDELTQDLQVQDTVTMS